MIFRVHTPHLQQVHLEIAHWGIELWQRVEDLGHSTIDPWVDPFLTKGVWCIQVPCPETCAANHIRSLFEELLGCQTEFTHKSTNPRAVSFPTQGILTLNLYLIGCYFDSLYWGTSFNCVEKTLKCCWHQLCISSKITQLAQWALPSMEDCSEHTTYVLLVMVPAKEYILGKLNTRLKRTENAACQQSEVGHSPCRLCVTTKSHWSGASQGWCEPQQLANLMRLYALLHHFNKLSLEWALAWKNHTRRPEVQEGRKLQNATKPVFFLKDPKMPKILHELLVFSRQIS